MSSSAEPLSSAPLGPSTDDVSDNAVPAGARFLQVTLTNFRSYDREELELDGCSTAFFGPNGAGKTNILEALSFFGPGRGLRGARLNELPRHGGVGGWAAAARLSSADGDIIKLGVGAEAANEDRRVCRIDGLGASGPSAFTEHVRFLWLTPQQDRLFLDGAGERRRFLDRMTQAHDASHARAASDYEGAMRQRQKLLEGARYDEAWLGALETQMAEAGVALAAARREVATLLASTDVAGLSDLEGVFPNADIALSGELEAALATRAAADVEEEFSARLKNNRRADAEAGRALIGPHKADLIVYHREKQTPARLCSTGEQKALLLGLFLANALALASLGPAVSTGDSKGFGGAPIVLLLDEIGAHLDSRRRAALFSILGRTGFQCFMTGTDKTLFEGLADSARIFKVENGSAERASG